MACSETCEGSAPFNVNIGAVSKNGVVKPHVLAQGMPAPIKWVGIEDMSRRDFLQFNESRVEVWDYWYRKVEWVGKGKTKKAKMVTCNAVFAGNVLVQGPTEYPEYRGKLPYTPIFNTYIPGVPMGRPELWDVEHLLREKYEQLFNQKDEPKPGEVRFGKPE